MGAAWVADPRLWRVMSSAPRWRLLRDRVIAARRTGRGAVLLTLSGWTSARIADAFGVREDTVRLWRSEFGRGGADASKASVAPGPPR